MLDKESSNTMARQRTHLVIMDPTETAQPALERGLATARNSNARLVAWLCTYKPVKEMGDATSARDGKATQMTEMEDWLKARLAEHDTSEVDIETHIEWNEKWWERAVAAASRYDAELVLKSVSTHRNLQRKLFRTPDIFMMRRCPAPLLLVRGEPRTAGRVLVALDFESREQGHERLNNIALAGGRRLADTYDSDLYAVIVRTKHSSLDYLLEGEDEGSFLEGILAERLGLEPQRLMIRDADVDVASTIAAAVDELSPDQLVMGTIARSGVAGMVIGNTAEKVLDRVECDVLTVG